MVKITAARITAWSLVVTVCLLDFIAWGSAYSWQLKPFSLYQLFPLLGLWAFSIMWTHYIMVAVKLHFKLEKAELTNYFRWTGYAVLALICLHPGILIYQRFHDGYGLPPHSYITYVAPGLGWLTILGTACLLIFLAFELRRWLSPKSWWVYVANASDLAMIGIAYHGLRLGTTIRLRWFRGVWLFYFASLVLVLCYKYYGYFGQRRTSSQI